MKIAGIQQVHQYQLFQKKNQHLIDTAKDFIKKEINIIVDSHPKIFLNEKLVNETKIKYKIDEKKLNILLGVGGSGPTKRIPSKTFIDFRKFY